MNILLPIQYLAKKLEKWIIFMTESKLNLSGLPINLHSSLMTLANLIQNDSQVSKDMIQTYYGIQKRLQELERLRKQLQLLNYNEDDFFYGMGFQIRNRDIERSMNSQSQVNDFLVYSLGLPPNFSQSQHNFRGSYKKYTRQIKQKAVSYHKSDGFSFNKVSRIMNIPVKNISRWCNKGIQRAEGAGRNPIDSNMEIQLNKWIRANYNQGQNIDCQILQQTAIKLCKVSSFCASQGWLKNFIKRTKLSEMYSFKNVHKKTRKKRQVNKVQKQNM